MRECDNRYDVVVIGGGVAGLAAASFLSKRGKRVVLLEQSHSLGGRAQTKQRDGFHLNLGPHALYRGGRGMQVLLELGVEPRGRVPSVSGAYAIKDGNKHTFPAGTVSLLTTGLFGLSAKLEAASLLASFARIDGERFMNVTAQEWLDQSVSHREVKEFVLAAFRVATYTNAPALMSAGAAIEQLKKAQDKSVLYLDRGWQTLVDGLHIAAKGAGVLIETEATVEAITRNVAGGVSSARLKDGREFKASTVAIASSPSVAVELVENAASTSLARWACEAIPVKAACLDVALDCLPRPKATFALGIDRPLYLSVHSAAARLAPDGSAMIHAAKYLPPDHSDSNDIIERELESLLDLVQPGWRDIVVYRRFLPDMVVMNAMPTAALSGTRGRPGPQVPDVPGLFVVGDWVGSEGLLVDAALASAKRAAEIISETESPTLAAVV